MSDQKNWDAALIKTWRLAGNVGDVYILFKALSGKRTDECESPLKRMPLPNIPWKVGVRVFVAEFLPKISARLWDQTPDKDILLLRKLETSPYDTMKTRMYDEGQAERASLLNNVKSNRKRMGMDTLNNSNRNQATDWGVTKGPSSSARMKRR
jgi:hypothetical protein